MTAVKTNDWSFMLTPFTNQRTVNELKESINAALKSLRPKVVVYIDDLDRLNGNEIIEVLRLIRNTANFNNLVYLVAFDKVYVKSALTSEKLYMGDKYLEKFFNLEVFIPMDNPRDILLELIGENGNEMQEKLEVLGGIEINQINKINTAILDASNLFNEVVTNYRDTKKILNQYIFEVALLKDKGIIEINPTDLLHIIILKTLYPSVFYYIFSENCEFIEPFDNSNDSIYMKLVDKSFMTAEKSKAEHDVESEKALQKYKFWQMYKTNTKSMIQELHLTKHSDYIMFGKLLESLFDKKNFTANERLAHVVTFEKYKVLSIEKSRLRISDIKHIIENRDIALLKMKLAINLQKEIFLYITERVENNLEEAINIIFVLLTFIEERVRIIGYDFKDFAKQAVIILTGEKRSKKNIKIDIPPKELGEKLISDVFESQNFISDTKSYLVKQLFSPAYYKHEDIIGLSQAYFQDLSVKLFNEFKSEPRTKYINGIETNEWTNRGLLNIYQRLMKADADEKNKKTLMDLFVEDENQLLYYCYSTLERNDKKSWVINLDSVHDVFGSLEHLYWFIENYKFEKHSLFFEDFSTFLIMNKVGESECKNFIWGFDGESTASFFNVVGESDVKAENKLKGVQVLVAFDKSVADKKYYLNLASLSQEVSSCRITFDGNQYYLLHTERDDLKTFLHRIQNNYKNSLLT